MLSESTWMYQRNEKAGIRSKQNFEFISMALPDDERRFTTMFQKTISLVG